MARPVRMKVDPLFHDVLEDIVKERNKAVQRAEDKTSMRELTRTIAESLELSRGLQQLMTPMPPFKKFNPLFP